MSLGLRLDVRQSQSLVLTPQLQQAIKLLQLSNLELAGVVDKELAENPFLHRPDGPSANGVPHVERERELSGSPEMLPTGRTMEDGWSPPAVSGPSDQRLHVTRNAASGPDEAGAALETRLTRAPTLAEHLRSQLMVSPNNPATRELACRLVDWLAEDGYLRESDAELAAELAVPEPAVTAARAAILSCDPAGIGAGDLAQCLAAQLQERNRFDPAMAVLLANLPLLARADFTALQRVCGVDLDDLKEMIAELKALDPRPGLSYAPSEPVEAVPDVLVLRGNGDVWRIELNHATLPRVLVDRGYYAEVARGCDNPRDREFLSERYQAASWLSKALDQRAKTVLRVAKAIFTRQIAFLEHGVDQLRPLVLRDIAEATGLHESTVSRATADKYVATPRGTFPLRYFFTTAIAGTDAGETHSAEAIRQQIRRMIETEQQGIVYSDDQIVAALKASGVNIARRTVAKYRESLGIASSVQRRRAKALTA